MLARGGRGCAVVSAVMPTTTTLNYLSAAPPADVDTFLVLGPRAFLDRFDALSAWLPSGLDPATWTEMLQRAGRGGNRGATASTYLGRTRLVVAVLPDKGSRHMSPAKCWATPALVKTANSRSSSSLLVLGELGTLDAQVAAAARAFPLYSRKDESKNGRRSVNIAALSDLDHGRFHDLTQSAIVAEAVRRAAQLVDMPTSELDVSAFVKTAQDWAEGLGDPRLQVEVHQGRVALGAQGMGGIWGVGKAATCPPALVSLTWTPEGAKGRIALVGKGVVYDTGGLSLKGKDHMPGMKGDMGGAAATLQAFRALVEQGYDKRVVECVLCLAENAMGPDSLRPDDILKMHSGKTVEVNNTDAEGRLCLADGVSWAARNGAELVLDLATLTGAALVATGRTVAAVYTPHEELETALVAAGRASGEDVFPLLYAPQLHAQQFKSQVADMRNSVKDRANAQASCAGWFIEQHLPSSSSAKWAHVDIAGPAWDGVNRGTGYGVGLVVQLCNAL